MRLVSKYLTFMQNIFGYANANHMALHLPPLHRMINQIKLIFRKIIFEIYNPSRDNEINLFNQVLKSKKISF